MGCLPEQNKVSQSPVPESKPTEQHLRTGKGIFSEHIDKFMGTRPIVQPELVVNAGEEYVNIDEENVSSTTGK